MERRTMIQEECNQLVAEQLFSISDLLATKIQPFYLGGKDIVEIQTTEMWKGRKYDRITTMSQEAYLHLLHQALSHDNCVKSLDWQEKDGNYTYQVMLQPTKIKTYQKKR